MDFGKTVNILRKKLDLTQDEIAKQIGVKKNTISNYENNVSKPQYEQLVKLCNLLKCDPNTLMINDIKYISSKLTIENQQVISAYQNLSDSDKRIVDFILGIGEYDIKSDPVETEPTKIYRFPIFYQSAAAGIGRLSETEEYQMKEFELKSMPSKAAFGMFIKGHSMETTIYEDDIVLIDPSVKVSSNLDDKIVVALFGDELICKRFSVNNDDQTYDFTSDNSLDKDKGRFNQKQSNFILIGKVVKILHVHDVTGKGILRYSED